MSVDQITLYAIDTASREFNGFDLSGVADVLSQFADQVPDRYSHALRRLAHDVQAVEVPTEEPPDVSDVSLRRVVTGEDAARRVDWSEFCEMLEGLAEDGVAAKQPDEWAEMVKLLRDRVIAFADDDVPLAERPVAVGATCVTEIPLPAGWRYVARQWGCVIEREDGRGCVEPMDLHGSKFGAFTRATTADVYVRVTTAKNTRRNFKDCHAAMRAVDWLLA